MQSTWVLVACALCTWVLSDVLECWTWVHPEKCAWVLDFGCTGVLKYLSTAQLCVLAAVIRASARRDAVMAIVVILFYSIKFEKCNFVASEFSRRRSYDMECIDSETKSGATVYLHRQS